MPSLNPNQLIKRFRELLPESQPLELTRRLVSFESENPPGKEKEVLEFLCDLLKGWEFDTKLLYTDSGRANLIASFKWGRGGKKLLFNGHLDVVPAGDRSRWSRQPFSAEVYEKHLYGRGSADMKGGVAAMLYAVRLVRKTGIDLGDAEVIFHLVSDEESGGSQGAGFLVDQGLGGADAAIVPEPTNLEVVVAEKGTYWVRVNVHGKSAHGATPQLGVNAIEKMAMLLPRLIAMDLSTSHPLLGQPTLNLGLINGGNKINMVADFCSLDLDRRCLPNENIDKFEKDLDNICHSFSLEQGVKIETEKLLLAKPFEISLEEKIVKIAFRNIERVTGRKSNPKGLSGFTDARFYILEAGTPTILLGPGKIDQAHTTDEFVKIEQLEKAALLYAMIIVDFFSQL